MSWHLVTCEYPPDVGGISDHTAQLASGLVAAGDDVHVWCPGKDRTVDTRVHVHATLGAFDRPDLERTSREMDACAGPRQLVVQWVPHGFGRRSMNLGFCLWVARRARRGDRVHVVVHEPYLAFTRGPWRHVAMALVHRVMTVVMLRAAHYIWLSTPAWEARLRPYLLGRRTDMRWLPIPGCEGSGGTVSLGALDRPLVGHFGSYGALVAPLLEERLVGLMASDTRPAVLLVGSGARAFCDRLIADHPEWNGRLHATGYVPSDRLGDHLAACDLLIQPYPDGVTTRRTSVMTGLARGCPVVTTAGHLTEPLWAEQGAVALVDVGDPAQFAATAEELLRDRDARGRLGARAREVYDAHFSVSRLVHTLRAA